ncbi:MAG: biopolymer transporter ExbD [Fibrobacteria bacterium]|nr:biopolymer transporter ExbD [Fibrobacteria bacterium]
MARRKLKKDSGSLNITSMMDMFTIVLVFLLKNFATEGNLMTSADNLILPVSRQSETPQEVAMSIVVDKDWILVDDQQIMETKLAQDQEKLKLEPISKILEEKRKEEEESNMAGIIDFSIGRIVLQFDRNLEYDIVTKMVATCGWAGYTNVRFAVTKTEEEG